MRSILVGQLQKKSPRQAKMRFQTICFVRNDFAHTCSHGITCCCEYISMVHTYCMDKWCTVLVAGCRRSPAGRCQVARSPAVASGRQRSPGRQVARSPVGRQVASWSLAVASGRQVARSQGRQYITNERGETKPLVHTGLLGMHCMHLRTDCAYGEGCAYVRCTLHKRNHRCVCAHAHKN